MWIKPEKIDMSNPNLEEDIICKRFISDEDWNKKFIIHNGKKVSTSELSKEFRLKRGTLCEGKFNYSPLFVSHFESLLQIQFERISFVLFSLMFLQNLWCLSVFIYQVILALVMFFSHFQGIFSLKLRFSN